MVRQAVANALPAKRKQTQRSHWKLQPAVGFIDSILQEDRQAPRKQRHTACRIWRRVQDNFPQLQISDRMMRRYVRQRKIELGWERRETCVPQSYAWGQEAQVDWYEAWAELGGERTKLQVFSMRSMASGGAFHRAYLHSTQQAFLEAHELAFDHFGGVFRRLRYDNLTLAVQKILRGYQREETARFIAFRSHWRFEASFCNPGAGHEKGGIEGEAGYFRRNHWVPVPQARDLQELNEQLRMACRQDEQRHICGREQTVGQAELIEREHLLPLAEEGFDLVEVSFPKVDTLGRAKARTNFYSVPLRAGIEVQARLYPNTVEFHFEGHCVARHERCYGRQQEVLDLEHYLEVLEHKPGALAGSKPLQQWRRQGRWPASFDTLWERLIQRHGRQDGTRGMIELLILGKTHSYKRLREAIESALQMGSSDVSTLRYLLTAERLQRPAAQSIDVGWLAQYERPTPILDGYDQLLAAVEVQL
jgi:transposase